MTRADEIREQLKRQHRPRPYVPGTYKSLICGASLGQSIDTCPYCEPLRRELAKAQREHT